MCLLAGCSKNPEKQKAELVASAEKYVAAGQYREAILQYRNAVQLDPNSAELNARLGDAYLHNEQYRDALLVYQKSLAADRNYGPAQIALAQIYLASQQFDEAQQMAARITEKDPDNYDAQVILANSYVGKQQLPAGIKVLQDLISRHPDYLQGYIHLGILYAAQGDMDRTREAFEQALKRDPGSVTARKAVASYYVARGEMAKAEEHYRAAVNLNPGSIEARQALAQFYFDQQRYPEAEALYQELVRMDGNSQASRFTLAKFYLAQGRLDDAAQLDRQLISEAPPFAPAKLQLAEIAMQQKRFDESERMLGELLKERREPQTLLLHARVLIERHRPEKAVGELEALQREEPNLAPTAFLMGVAYSQMGNQDRAQHYFEQAIGFNPQSIDAFVALAEIMLDRGLNDVALKYAQQIIEKEPGRAEAHLYAGSAYANMNNLAKAEAEFQQFTAMEPKSPLGLVRLGYLALKQKQYEAAEKQFERALSLDGRNADALSGLMISYRLRGQGEKGIARMRRLLQEKDTADLEAVLGKAYTDLGQFSQAEASLQRAAQLDAQNTAAHVLLAALYAEQKAPAKVAEQYEIAVKLNPRSVMLWTALGATREGLGDTEGAKKAYEKALEVDANSAVAANNLAWILSEQGADMDRALDLARRARQQLPNLPGPADTLGWIYYKRGLVDSAVPLLQEAVKMQPDRGVYRFHLAAALLSAGKKDQARGALRDALRLDASLKQRDDVQKLMRQM